MAKTKVHSKRHHTSKKHKAVKIHGGFKSMEHKKAKRKR